MWPILAGALTGALLSYASSRFQRFIDTSVDRWRERQQRVLLLAEELMEQAGNLQVLTDRELLERARHARTGFPVTQATESRLWRASDDMAALAGNRWIGSQEPYVSSMLANGWPRSYEAARQAWLAILGLRSVGYEFVSEHSDERLEDETAIRRLRHCLHHLIDRSETVHRWVRRLHPLPYWTALGRSVLRPARDHVGVRARRD